ncbi:unnamed protein product [Cylindrotheca closterium]|uniref:Uncharacterized protein n=1 Tax=Cylindrotheca closterium TaxID=2856 RepID=A0AAD2CNV0_9STRA|nr:unnamed protein product [Cylindrotheca closterium]
MTIRKILGIPWLIVLFLNGDTLVDLLEQCIKDNYFFMTWWLESDYNAQLYYRSDRAVFIFARARRAKKVSMLSGVDGPDKETRARRKLSKSMVRDFRRERRDLEALEFLKACYEEGADLSWPDTYGNTVLSVAIRRCYEQCVKWLLKHHDADPNRQDHYEGNTGMRILVQRIGKLGDGTAAAMLRLLLNNNASDFTTLNFHGDRGIIKNFNKLTKERGHTPYMMLRNPSKFPDSANALKPRPSFQQLEKLLKTENKSARQKCDDVYKLISESHNGDRSLHHLRVMDMLFCANEGTNEDLELRRTTIFNHFLKQVLLLSTQDSSEEEKLTHDDVALLWWMYYQS